MVAESFGSCLTAFDVLADGRLTGRRTFAEIPDSIPDGICADDEGGIWVADNPRCEFVRVVEGGEVTDRIRTGDRLAVDCALGGPDGRTLYLLTTDAMMPADTHTRKGQVEVRPVPRQCS